MACACSGACGSGGGCHSTQGGALGVTVGGGYRVGCCSCGSPYCPYCGGWYQPHRPYNPWNPVPMPQTWPACSPRGCICPPGAEATCQGVGCPRKAWGGEGIVWGTGNNTWVNCTPTVSTGGSNCDPTVTAAFSAANSILLNEVASKIANT